MTKVAQYEGNFIKAEDLPIGKVYPLVISKVSQPGEETASDKRKIDKLVLHFEGRDKGLIVNQTHYDLIKHLHGSDIEAWIGKTVLVQRRFLIESFGEFNIACVRLVPPNGEAIRIGLNKRLGQAMPFTEQEIADYKSIKTKRRG